MSATNWDELDAQFESKFKNYAGLGEHKVKVESVSIKDVDTSNGKQHIISFNFKETDDTKYQKVDRWVFKNNEGFRKYHFRNLFIMLGCTEDGAKKAVETCEESEDYDKIAEAYAKTLGQVAAKYKRDVKIEVRNQVDRDGHYVRSDKGAIYTESEFMNFDNNPKHGVYFAPTKAKEESAPLDIKPEEIMDGTDEISESDIPF